MEYQTLSMMDNQDERGENVHLIVVSGDCDKTTAEDCGDYWMILDWELHDHDETKIWFERSGYSISKDFIKQLAGISHANACAELDNEPLDNGYCQGKLEGVELCRDGISDIWKEG